ncbi:upstream-binding protein 1 isoform X2 [Rousettus aegyptiacus]|uniref:upstream-binding protein 1 isoform X2 n=1 Tax=Rousettus aegyptiacus TaxID=9407 RepID=UPI00168D8F21|nr:upstream-binding protein 1 isoform X2 [Rousettus aegyptiacus]
MVELALVPSKMLFWHNQPEHLWPSPEEPYPGPTSSLLRESLPLPYLKQEELPSIPRQEPPCLAFQYVLCAATSPAVKQQEEALTYLNQGQSYEVQMLCNSKLGDATQWPQLLKIHCISTEFTPRKKGGEKGVPFCLQVDTFKPSDKELLPEHLHSAGCLIKVFKPKGADRKLKTDQEKIEKQPLFQTACESTVFVECSLWPEPSAGPYQPLSPLTSPNSCKFLSPERLCCSPPFVLDTLAGSPAEVSFLSNPTTDDPKTFSASSSHSPEWWPCSLVDRCGSEPSSLRPRDTAVVTLAPGLQLLEDASQFHWHRFAEAYPPGPHPDLWGCRWDPPFQHS